MFAANWFIIVSTLVAGLGFGGYAAINGLVRSINTYRQVPLVQYSQTTTWPLPVWSPQAGRQQPGRQCIYVTQTIMQTSRHQAGSEGQKIHQCWKRLPSDSAPQSVAGPPSRLCQHAQPHRARCLLRHQCLLACLLPCAGSLRSASTAERHHCCKVECSKLLYNTVGPVCRALVKSRSA